MTTTKTLLAKAAQLEEDAKALRRAAAVMNGHLTQKAQETLPQRLEAAIATRRKATGKPTPPRQQWVSLAERAEQVRAVFADGAQHSTRDIGAALGISSSRAMQVLKGMLGIKRHGVGNRTRYSLRGVTPVKAKRAPTAASNGSSNGSGKLPVLLDVLEANGPMKIKQLVAAVKATGYDGPLTGIHNYVKSGYIGRTHGGKYKFKARPAPDVADHSQSSEASN